MQQNCFSFTRSSSNRKLGGIPVTTSGRSTCPTTCGLRKNGCYAEQFPLVLHWNKVSDGKGISFEEMLHNIAMLPKFALWRWAQAGDLPGNGTEIDQTKLRMLARANKGRNGFGYTHYRPDIESNAAALREANQEGFTINLSAENLEQADRYLEIGAGPVVTLLPHDQLENVVTPKGNLVIVCPASKGDTTCAQCAICANADRKAVVGFPAHGSGKARANKVFFATVSH